MRNITIREYREILYRNAVRKVSNTIDLERNSKKVKTVSKNSTTLPENQPYLPRNSNSNLFIDNPKTPHIKSPKVTEFKQLSKNYNSFSDHGAFTYLGLISELDGKFGKITYFPHFGRYKSGDGGVYELGFALRIWPRLQIDHNFLYGLGQAWCDEYDETFSEKFSQYSISSKGYTKGLDVGPKTLKFSVGKNVKLGKGDLVSFHISKIKQFASNYNVISNGKMKAVCVKRHGRIYLKFFMLNKILAAVNKELDRLAGVDSEPCEAMRK